MPEIGGTGVGGPFSFEIRVRFPLVGNGVLEPTVLSGAIATFTDVNTNNVLSLQYEKATLSTQTGTIFVTSSNGRVDLVNAPIFDENPYNIAMIRETVTGSFTLSIIRFESDELMYATSSIVFSGSAGFPP
jgi:hypothetical protein